MKQQKMLNTNKGITLIALVITIIVMLILVAVTISMAVNGGLFDYAGKAVGDTNNAMIEEGQLGNGGVTINGEYYNSIDEYLEREDEQDANKEKFSEIYTTSTRITQDSYTAVIPKGFAVGISEGINQIEDGLVITDAVDSKGYSTGNEFVWVPVNYTASGNIDSNGLDLGFLEVFKRNIDDEDFREPETSSSSYYRNDDGTTEVDDYYDMMKSVQQNKGFYVARFEAGTEEPRYEGVANGTDVVVIKRDVYPYNYVSWGKDSNEYRGIMKISPETYLYDEENGVDQGYSAVHLSKHLLDGKDTGVISNLCFGVQWDAMLNFIAEEKNIEGSQALKVLGNLETNPWTITRTTAKYAIYNNTTYKLETWTPITTEGKSKTDSDKIILTTGASDEFKAKNIYDVVGNCAEWTSEGGGCRIRRGASFDTDAYDLFSRNAYCPGEYVIMNGSDLGFRPALYIKNSETITELDA